MKTDIPVLYEDNHLLVIVKPVNMPVQADDSRDPDVLTVMKDYLVKKYDKPGDAYLGLVQRLDRPVGGCMVLAKTSKAAARLTASLQRHDLHKTYLAVTEGHPDAQGEWTDYLVKDGSTNTVRTTDAAHGKKAILTYRVAATAGPLALAVVDLQTGRPHQIRVQFASRGYPLWGDQRYSHQAVSGQQIALWSWKLTLEHPVSHQVLSFACLPPKRQPWDGFDLALLG